MTQQSILSAVGSIFGGKVVTMLVGIFTTPVLARFLGSDGYGVYATILAIFGLTQILMSSGISSASQAYFSRSRGPGWVDQVWGYLFRVAGALALLSGFAFAGVAYFGIAADLLGPDFTGYFYLLAIYAIALQYSSYVRRVLMGLQLEQFSEPLTVIKRTTFATIAIGLAYFGHGVGGVLFGHIVSCVLIVVIGIWVLRDHVDLTAIIHRVPSNFPTSDVLTFNIQSTILVFFFSSLYHVDVLMLQGYASESKIGIYKAALVLVEFLWLVPQSLQWALIQRVSEYWEENRLSKVSDVATRSTQYVALLTILLALGLGALADTVVPIYFGEEYSSAVTPLLILLPGTAALAIGRPLFAISKSNENLRPLILATGFTAILNLVLNAVLIPQYGVNGAAIASTVSYTTLLITLVICAWFLNYRPVDWDVAVRILAVAAIAGPVILGLGSYLDGLLSLFIVPPIGAIVFLVLSVASGAIPQDDIQQILDKARHRFDRESR